MAAPAKDFRNNVQADHPGSTVVERGRKHIKHLAPDGTFILDASLGAIHYGPQHDQEIDTAWVDSTAPWDKEMILAGYNAYALTDFSSGQVIKYVHPDSGEEITFQPQQLQFTNDLDQIQSVGDVQSVSAVVDDDELQWSSAYGTDLDFTWETQTSRLAKKLTIDNLTALGTPAQYIIDGGNPVLRLQFIFQVSSNVDLYINGEKWDKTKTKETSDTVEFRNKTTGQPLWWFGQAHARDEAPEDIIAAQRFTKRANSLFVEVRIPWEWLESASYPVVVDPTIDDQVDDGYHDAHEDGDDTSFTNSNSYWYANANTSASDRKIGGLIFDPINIAGDDTITVAYITVKAINSSNDDPYCDIYCEDEDDVNDFNTEQDVYNRTKTSASASWSATDIGTDWYNSPSIVTAVQEVIDRPGWSSGNAMGVIVAGKSDDVGNLVTDSYDGSTADCSKLHIEYTEGADTISVSDGITVGESSNVEKQEGIYVDNISDGITIGDVVTTYSDTQDINWDITESDGITVGDTLSVEIPPAEVIPTFIGKQETTYEVWLCDQYGRRLTIIDNLITFDIVKVVNSVSYCSVTLPGNFHQTYQTLIGIDYMVEFWRSPAQGAMQLEAVFFVRDIVYEEDVKGNDIIILSGPDGNDLLDRRIVGYAAGSSQADKTDNADDMIKEIVRENLGSSAEPDRDLTDLNFTVAGDVTGGPSITKGFAWRNVLRTIQDITYMSAENGTDLYFDVVPVVISSSEIGFEFRTYTDQPGQDRTYDSNNPVVFSKEWGNLANPILMYDYTKEANYVYGGGQGEGADRTISEQSDSARVGLSVWNRREKFADARNETTANGVANKAEEVLNENKPFKRFTGQLLDTPQSRYGVDWYFGDKVEISYRGIQFQGVATALKIRLDKEGNEILTVKVEVTG